MRIPLVPQQKIKAGLHAAQATLVIITGILALAIITEAGGTSGQVGYVFALCFLTAPAVVYQILVPMWSRAWRFANAYAYAAIDTLFTILWFAAFVSVAAWQSQGVAKGKHRSDGGGSSSSSSSSSCSHFAYGSTTRCQTAQATVAFGVFIFLLFAATAVMSVRGVLAYRRSGVAPHAASARVYGPVVVDADADQANKDVWSVDIDEVCSGRLSFQSDMVQTDTDARKLYGQFTDDDRDALLRVA